MLPHSLNLNKLSFYSRWNGERTNAFEDYARPDRTFCFGYVENGAETAVSRAVSVIYDEAQFSLDTRSMLWRIAEITVERQNHWLVFSRHQDDLSMAALEDFLVDCRAFLEHLKEEDRRANFRTTKIG